MQLLRIYDYLLQARERVFTAIRPLTPEQYHRPFEIGVGTIASTITHMMISEWYYIERVEGRSVPPYREWPIQYHTPPAFDVVESTWRQQGPRVRALLAGETDWSRKISYDSFPDDKGRRFRISASVADVVSQLVLHEVHHRAQLMAMLRGLGNGVPALHDIDYHELMYQREPLA